MVHLLASLGLVAATLLAARRFGVRLVAVPACLPLAWSLAAPLESVFVTGLAPAPLIGWLAALQVQRRRGYGEVIAVASLPGLAMALMLLAEYQSDAWPKDDLVAGVAASLQQAAAGASLPDAVNLQQLVSFTLRLLPGMAYASLLLVAVVGYRVAQAVSGRVGPPLPAAVPLRHWRLWEPLIWVPIAALALLLVADGALQDLALNALLVMGLLNAAQGLAVVRWLLWRVGARRFLEGLVYVLLAFTAGLSLVLLAGVGLVDNWFDWRRLGHRRDEPSAEAG